MPSCSIKNCSNTSRNTKSRNISFLCFPKDPEMIEKWKVLCKENVNPKSARVCSEHFQPTHFKDKSWLKNLVGDSGNVRVKLKPDAIPMKYIESNATKLKNESCDSKKERIKTQPKPNSRDLIKVNIAKVKNEARNERIKPKGTISVLKNVRAKSTSSAVLNLVSPVPSDCLPKITKLDASVKKSTELEMQMSEIQQLKRKLATVISERDHLKRRLATCNRRCNIVVRKGVKRKIHETLSPFFTPTQIKMYMNPSLRKTRWTRQDIASAISLKSVSPKAYRYLRNTRQIPLPAMSTIRRWIANFNMDEGILTDVLTIMKCKAQGMTEIERATVISFGEMYLSNQMQVEWKNERVADSYKRCLIVIARGLFKKWKQPIYYAFNREMTKDILINIIIRLHKSGYMVHAVTGDVGPENLNLWTSLNIRNDEDNTHFQHPCQSNVNVHLFADVPQVFKSIRDHFFNYGLHVNGRFITSAVLENLLKIDNEDVRNSLKLPNATMAEQLFSAKSAGVIERCGKRGLFGNDLEWNATAKFIKLMNDWFDIFNSTCKYGSHSGLDGYGVRIPDQNKILDEVTSIFKEMRVDKRKVALPFQRGVLICNTSLQSLYRDLRKKFHRKNLEMPYIATSRLNCDAIENLFSYLRSVGDGNEKPTAMGIRYRLRWYMLGKYSSNIFTAGKDTSIVERNDDERCLTSDIAEDFNTLDEQVPCKDVKSYPGNVGFEDYEMTDSGKRKLCFSNEQKNLKFRIE